MNQNAKPYAQLSDQNAIYKSLWPEKEMTPKLGAILVQLSLFIRVLMSVFGRGPCACGCRAHMEVTVRAGEVRGTEAFS